MDLLILNYVALPNSEYKDAITVYLCRKRGDIHNTVSLYLKIVLSYFSNKMTEEEIVSDRNFRKLIIGFLL